MQTQSTIISLEKDAKTRIRVRHFLWEWEELQLEFWATLFYLFDRQVCNTSNIWTELIKNYIVDGKQSLNSSNYKFSLCVFWETWNLEVKPTFWIDGVFIMGSIVNAFQSILR